MRSWQRGLPFKGIEKEKLRAAILKGVMNPRCERIPGFFGDDLEVKQIFDYIHGNLQPSEFSFPSELVMEGRLELSHAIWERQIGSVPLKLWENEKFVFEAVSQYGNALSRAPLYCANRRIVMAAIRDNSSAVKYVETSPSDDIDVLGCAAPVDLEYLKLSHIEPEVIFSNMTRCMKIEICRYAKQLYRQQIFRQSSGCGPVEPAIPTSLASI